MTMKTIRIILTVGIIFLIVGASYANDGWQVTVRAKVLNAENKLIVGQKVDATDTIDGRYDIPAFLAGDIQAYIDLEGQTYWSDIKQMCSVPCKKNWSMVIESNKIGEIIKLTWNISDIPTNMSLLLIDTVTGEIVDMKNIEDYVYVNSGTREFIMEMEK